MTFHFIPAGLATACTWPQGENPDEERMIQALCNTVISAAAVDGEEDEESVKLLTALLAEEGVDPNAGHQASWDKVRVWRCCDVLRCAAMPARCLCCVFLRIIPGDAQGGTWPENASFSRHTQGVYLVSRNGGSPS